MTTAEPGNRAGRRRRPHRPRDRAAEPGCDCERLVEAGPAVAYARDPRPPHRLTFVSANVRAALRADRGEELLTAPTAVRRPAAPGRRSAPSPTTGTGCCARARPSPSTGCAGRAGLYWIRDEQSVVRDADGRTVEIVGSLLDVTDQKRTEERAERLQELTAGLAAALTPEHVAASALLPALAVLEAQGVALILREDGRRPADAHRPWRRAGYQSELVEHWQRLPLDAGHARPGMPCWPAGPVYLATAAEARERFPAMFQVPSTDPPAGLGGGAAAGRRRRDRRARGRASPTSTSSRRPSAGSWRRSRTSARWRWSGPGSTGPRRPSGSGWPRCCPGCRPA